MSHRAHPSATPTRRASSGAAVSNPAAPASATTRDGPPPAAPASAAAAAAEPKLTTTAPKSPPRPALVVFGLDRLNKPHASWFAADEQEAATKAAATMGFSVVRLGEEAQVELARKLPRGRLFEGGRAFVPFVKHALHEKITRLAADPVKAEPSAPAATEANKGAVPSQPLVSPAQEKEPAVTVSALAGEIPAQGSAVSTPIAATASSPPPQAGASAQRRPKNWDEISPGDLVLAYDGETEGWFKAIVLGPDGDLLRLRWRDYPLERLNPQRRDQLALLPPSP